MNAEFTAIIKTLVAEQGKDALVNPARCKAFLADYTKSEFTKERRLLLGVVEAGAAKEIDAAVDLDICKRQQIQCLQEELFMAEDMAADVIDMLAFVLRGEAPATETELQDRFAPEQPQPAPPEQNTSSKPVSESPGQIQTSAMLRKTAKVQLRGSWLPSAGMAFVYLCCIIVFTVLGVGIGDLIFFGPLMLGFCGYFLKKARGETVTMSSLFGGFSMFGSGLLINILLFVFTALWTLLLIIPGIIKSLSYSMAYYIILDNPGMNAMDAITASRKMMNGHKRRLFRLKLSFIGWGLLCIPSLGIGFLWLIPYIALSQANFYEDLKNNARPEK
jgi:uncharacterized membrane protein